MARCSRPCRARPQSRLGSGSGSGLGYLPRTLNLGRLEAVPLHLDLLCLHVVALLRQGHLEVEAEVQVEV